MFNSMMIGLNTHTITRSAYLQTPFQNQFSSNIQIALLFAHLQRHDSTQAPKGHI